MKSNFLFDLNFLIFVNDLKNFIIIVVLIDFVADNDLIILSKNYLFFKTDFK